MEITNESDTEIMRNYAIFRLTMMNRVIDICEKGVDWEGNKLKAISVSPAVYYLLRSNIIKLARNKPVIYNNIRIKNKRNLLDNEIELERL